MSERDDLLTSVANTIRTYREGDLPEPTPEHVDRWLRQFTIEQQLPFLREFNHVLKQCFLTREVTERCLANFLTAEALTGSDPAAYWSSANFLNIQQNGQSQKEMLNLFTICLKEKYDLDIHSCGKPSGDFIYLDDVMFSGNRVGNDLGPWITDQAPQSAKVNVILVALHLGGSYFIEKKLQGLAKEAGKEITITFWRILAIENRKHNKNSSSVLWPATIPSTPEVQAYLAEPSKFPFEPRESAAQTTWPFSSEAGRQVLESEFLIAGTKIRAMCEDPKPSMRPLGFSPFGVGFGSTIVTYRNCPNNCPLALWWGDPDATSGALHWYPLLAREVYSSLRNIFDDFKTI